MRRGKLLAASALCTALIALGAQLCIPSPMGVPITLQLFFIAVSCFALGLRVGILAVFIYLLIGAVGVPVFSAFGGGVHILLSPTGGFLWGFLPLALCLGTACDRKALTALAVSLFGLLLCHACGIAQLCFITGVGFGKAFITVSLPYFIKDILLTVVAYYIAIPVKKALSTSG